MKLPRLATRKLTRREIFEVVIPLEIIILFTAASFFLPGGEDLYGWYRPFAEGCLTCGMNPWHAYWLLRPIAWAPLRLLWPLWTLLTGLVLFSVSRRLGTNPTAVLLAFPAMGLIWLGQVDGLIVLGLGLALLAPNAYLRGAGLALVSVKPHVAGLAGLVLLWHEKERLKMLALLAAVLAISFAAWGLDWPVEWLRERRAIDMPVWGLATLFPYGLAALPAILVVKGKREQVTVALLVSALAIPWFGVYSYAAFLPLVAPWWGVPLSYAWAAAYPWLGNRAMQFAWVLPLGLLVYRVGPVVLERRPGLKALAHQTTRQAREQPPNPPPGASGTL